MPAPTDVAPHPELVVTFETTPAGEWLATAQTDDGLLTAIGQTLDEARAAIEKQLMQRVKAASR